MSFSALLRVVFLTFLVALTGCSRQKPCAVERVAIVAFDNLTRSPENGWTGRAIANLAAIQTAGDPRIQTFDAASLRDAQSRFATQTLSGYLTDDAGSLTLHARLRDEATGQTLRSLTASDSSGSLTKLAAAMAAETGAAVRRDVPAPSVPAMRALLSAAGDDPQDALAAAERAIAADAGFGAAHLARVEILARLGRREEMVAALQQARSANLTPGQRAQIDVLTAEVQGNQAGRAAALLRFAQLTPGSVQVWRAAMDAQLAARAFEQAVRASNAILELDPEDESALNTRGYAYTYAGQREQAEQALEEYRRRKPESANAIDSQAESMFYFGRFDEAEKLFLEAHAKNPAQLNGNEPFRAALSRYVAGDLAGADKLFEQFLAEARKRKDPLVSTRALLWQCMTGRMPRDVGAEPLHQLIQALWTLAGGDRDGARGAAERTRAGARNPAVANLAGLILLLAQPSASAEEWNLRLQRALPPPLWQAQGSRLLGWALLLDRKPVEAAVPLRQIFNSVRPDLGNTERMLLTWALTDAGQIGEARKVMPHGFFPPPALDPGLELIVYPKIRDVRKKLRS